MAARPDAHNISYSGADLDGGAGNYFLEFDMTKILIDRATVKQALEALASYSVGERLNASQVNDLIAQLEAALEQPAQEPVAWMKHENGMCHLTANAAIAERDGMDTLLYAAPQARQPLTDEQIKTALHLKSCEGYRALVRQIEAAHGIKEGT